jgi:hypothetical protein
MGARPRILADRLILGIVVIVFSEIGSKLGTRLTRVIRFYLSGAYFRSDLLIDLGCGVDARHIRDIVLLPRLLRVLAYTFFIDTLVVSDQFRVKINWTPGFPWRRFRFSLLLVFFVILY